MIATRRQSAGRAIVPTILQRLWHTLTTDTDLASSAWVHLHQYSPGAFCLVREHSDKLRPSRIVNGLRQQSASETFNIQILDGNQAILVDQLARQLVVEICPLVANVDMGTLEQLYRLTSAVAALLPPRHFSLTAAQSGFCVSVVPGILNLCPIDQHGETVQSYVDSGCTFAGGERMAIAVRTEADKPSTSFALDGGRFDRPFDGPVQFDLDVTCSLHANTSVIEKATTLWMLREGNRIVAKRRAIPWDSRLFPALTSRVERVKGIVHTMQDILCTLRIDQRQAPIRAHGWQLAALVVEVDRLTARFPRAHSFFQRCVVQACSLANLAVQKVHLWSGGIDPVFKGDAHLIPVYA